MQLQTFKTFAGSVIIMLTIKISVLKVGGNHTDYTDAEGRTILKLI